MPTRKTTRYCADPEALSAMKRDGLGWGHDLECGIFYGAARPPKPGAMSRLITVFKRRT
jgi:hypothetical protein